MKAEILNLLPVWGPWILCLSAFLSNMMIPVPTSFLLISAGALSGTGHLYLPMLVLGATAGATLGDVTAYWLARRLAPKFLARQTAPGSRHADVMKRAQDFMAKRGLLAVFLSRWVLTPLGPTMNLVSGAAALPFAGFAAVSLVGEALWATVHLTIGHLAGRQFRHTDSAEIKALAVAAALAFLLLLAGWLWRRRRRPTI